MRGNPPTRLILVPSILLIITSKNWWSKTQTFHRNRIIVHFKRIRIATWKILWISFYKCLIDNLSLLRAVIINPFLAFLIEARIKKEKISKPLLKNITWEEVKLVSVDVIKTRRLSQNFNSHYFDFAFKSALVCPRYHLSRNIFARQL